ncbi:DUF4269 domain-containing protein [Dyadobacter luteus]|uniref:DUF4269 domain-containing protein n=1 Tax=Dyadobacter luteus TaxID=2259619 RepID=A0A3D8YH15_9BACT|nr:DUF4269 domain-containing protein [Dyadobacter luteus]REA64098.1 DUF4269 domain-containing protein [Dyadobacter luteus]
MIDFSNIEYLKSGNKRQRDAYDLLTDNEILLHLKEFDPLLAGTIPIEIDLEHSDLDIICCSDDIDYFFQKIRQYFSHLENFTINIRSDGQSVVASFRVDAFEIEIFGQSVPSREQFAYRHMLVEHQLLQAFGEAFRKEIIRLKSVEYKTEPAFARALGLTGNPYEALLACNVDEIIEVGWFGQESGNQDFEGK